MSSETMIVMITITTKVSIRLKPDLHDVGEARFARIGHLQLARGTVIDKNTQDGEDCLRAAA